MQRETAGGSGVVPTSGVKTDLALQGLGRDEPAHDGQAQAADSASDGANGRALGPAEAVCNGDDSRANQHSHQQVDIPAHRHTTKCRKAGYVRALQGILRGIHSIAAFEFMQH